MSPEMHRSLGSSRGAVVLFGALAALVGLMYLLTAPMLFRETSAGARRDGAPGQAGQPQKRRASVAVPSEAPKVVALAGDDDDRSAAAARWRWPRRSRAPRRREVFSRMPPLRSYRTGGS